MIYRNPNKADVGASSEMLVMADLLSLGFQVFRAVSPQASFDLVAVNGDGQMFKIEVKTVFAPSSLGIVARAQADILASLKTINDITVVEYRKLPTMERMKALGGQWHEEEKTGKEIDLARKYRAAREIERAFREKRFQQRSGVDSGYALKIMKEAVINSTAVLLSLSEMEKGISSFGKEDIKNQIYYNQKDLKKIYDEEKVELSKIPEMSEK